MTIRIINQNEVPQLLSMNACIELMEQALMALAKGRP
jgi:hypothetical protein